VFICGHTVFYGFPTVETRRNEQTGFPPAFISCNIKTFYQGHLSNPTLTHPALREDGMDEALVLYTTGAARQQMERT